MSVGWKVNPYYGVLFGVLPDRRDRRTLRWMHREHLHRARIRSRMPFEITPAAHINAAAQCRRAMKGLTT